MKRSWRILIILGIIIVVFNIIVFAVPFSRTSIFWLSYAFSMFAFIVQFPISSIAFKKGKMIKSKVYGWPIMRCGLCYLATVLLCAFLFTILSETIVSVPVWIPLICYVLLTGIVAIGLISVDSVRNFVEQEDTKLKIQTDFMKGLYSEANALEKSVSDFTMKKILSKIADEIRYSDPVSRTELETTEAHLYEIFGIIREGVAEKDIEKVRVSCEQFHQQLMIRNSICKAGKS